MLSSRLADSDNRTKTPSTTAIPQIPQAFPVTKATWETINAWRMRGALSAIQPSCSRQVVTERVVCRSLEVQNLPNFSYCMLFKDGSLEGGCGSTLHPKADGQSYGQPHVCLNRETERPHPKARNPTHSRQEDHVIAAGTVHSSYASQYVPQSKSPPHQRLPTIHQLILIIHSKPRSTARSSSSLLPCSSRIVHDCIPYIGPTNLDSDAC